MGNVPELSDVGGGVAMWLVMAAFPFKSMTANGWPVGTDPGEPTHFAPVFTSKEDADKWSGGRFEVLEIARTNNLNKERVG
jgi:hypothetical protein